MAETKKILVVEDEFIFQLDLKEKLLALGCDVVDMCSSGKAALEAARKHQPDIVLMDIHIEGAMDGVEAAGVLRQELDIPVLFLTAYVDDETIRRASHTEPLGYLIKPLQEAELKANLEIAFYRLRMERQRLYFTQRLSTVGQMASAITHEINNPMAAIAACVESLSVRIDRGRYDPEFFQKYLGIVIEEIQRCKSISQSIMSFVRQTEENSQGVDLNKLIEDVTTILSFQRKYDSIETIKNLQPGLPMAAAEEGALRQAVLNVILNAYESMESGGSLDISSSVDGDSLLLKVSDNGPGIAEDLRAKIFKPFFSTKKESGGSGIGLSVARSIVRASGGEMDFSCPPEGGTVFTFTLPVKKTS